MAKKNIRKLLSAAMAGLMLANIQLSALSYTALGEVTDIKRDTVGDGLYYSELVSETESGKTQRSYILEYLPSEGTLPLVRYGSTVYGKDRLGTLVSAASDGGNTVFAAVNGDFYSMQTGVPMGIVIDRSELITSDDSKYAMGFTSDGKAVIGKPSLAVTVKNESSDLPPLVIDHINKYPTVWGIYMLTDRFSSTTLSAAESMEIVIELDGRLPVSGTVHGTVIDVITDDMNTSIPEGCAVITVAEDSSRYNEIVGAFKKGDAISVSITCDPIFEDVETAIGGGDLILEDGTMPDGIIDEDHEKTVNPRTAVGIKEDGTVVFYAIDGRTNASVGLKESELSSVMAELGCKVALNLDGGGSTTVMVKASGEEDCVYVNVPSDGSYRSVANGVLFVSAHKPDGEAAHLSVFPNTPYVLRGSTVKFSARALDRAYTPLDIYLSDDMLTASYRDDYSEGAGNVSGGSYTAGMTAGEYKLSLANGGISGDVSVIVKDKIDELTVSPKYTKVKPGSLVEIDVAVKANGRELIATPSSFYYTLNGTHIIPNEDDYPGAMLLCDLGYLDMNGNFQSFGGEREGKVEIGVWFDEFVRFVTVNIGTGPDTVSDFDDIYELGKFKISSSDDLYVSAAEGRRAGYALEFGFSHNNTKQEELASVKLREYMPISKDAESIKIFAKGDISGVLTATVKDEDGNSYDLSYTVTGDYSASTGWRELTAVIPTSLRTGMLYLTKLLTISDAGEASRRIILDDAIVFYGEYEKNNLTGFENHWAADNILKLYDMGVILDNDCTSTSDGKLAYSPDKALTRGEFAKLISLYKGVASARYDNDGAKLDTSTPEEYVRYIRAAIDHGLMSGRGIMEDGAVLFDHNASITREEAFKVIGSLLKSAETELTFSDKADISDWAVSGTAKCVGAGIVGGYDDNTIRPKATITRAELSAILCRMS